MKKIVLQLVFLLFTLTGFAQKQGQLLIDSLLIEIKSSNGKAKAQLCLDIAKQYMATDVAKCELYAKKSISESKKSGSQLSVADGQKILALGFYNAGKNIEALTYADSAMKVYKVLGNVCSIGEVLNQKGKIYQTMQRNPDALNCFLLAIKALEACKINADEKIVRSYTGLGSVYLSLEDYNKSLINYTKAINLYKTMPDKKFELAMSVGNKALLFDAQKKYHDAIVNYKIAQNMLPKNHPSYQLGLAYISSWISIAYESLKDYDMAIKSSDKAINLLQKLNNKELMANMTLLQGNCLLNRGIITKNKNYLNLAYQKINEGLKFFKEIRSFIGISHSYEILSDYFAATKNFEKSLIAYKHYHTYKDSIYNSDVKQTIKNLEDKRTIELKEKEIQINKLSLQAKEKQKWYYISGLGLFVVILGLLFWQSYTRKKLNTKLLVFNNELDQANKIKTRFFSILNHDLRSPVSNLIHFLHLQKEAPEMLSESDKQRLETKTLNTTENLLQSMEDLLLWSKGQMESFKPTIKLVAVKNLFEDTDKHFTGTENVQLRFENPNNIIIITDEDYLKTIMRNLTSNAIKALVEIQNPVIVWKAWQEDNHSYLSITDNGSGGKTEQFKALYDEKEVVGVKSGLGLHLIRDLAKAINCKVSVDTKPDGTTFLLVI